MPVSLFAHACVFFSPALLIHYCAFPFLLTCVSPPLPFPSRSYRCRGVTSCMTLYQLCSWVPSLLFSHMRVSLFAHACGFLSCISFCSCRCKGVTLCMTLYQLCSWAPSLLACTGSKAPHTLLSLLPLSLICSLSPLLPPLSFFPFCPSLAVFVDSLL